MFICFLELMPAKPVCQLPFAVANSYILTGKFMPLCLSAIFEAETLEALLMIFILFLLTITKLFILVVSSVLAGLI